MKVFLVLAVVSIDIILTYAQYYGVVRDKPSTKSFGEYPNTSLTSVREVREITTADYRQCVRICEFDEAKCEAINVVPVSNGMFKCLFFETAQGTFETIKGTIFISRHEVRNNQLHLKLTFWS